MAIKSRKKRSTIRKTTITSDSSSSESGFITRHANVDFADHNNQDVVRWGYTVILICWSLFVVGVGGALGIWDHILGFQDGRVGDLACYFSLIVVTGFTWTVLNWFVCESALDYCSFL